MDEAGIIKSLKARRRAAQGERDSFQPLLDDAYDFAIPYRRSLRERTRGEKRVEKIYDHTAVLSTFRGAGRIQQDIWPTGETPFQLEVGPVAKAIMSPEERDAMGRELEKISELVAAMFLDGQWDQAFNDMAVDLYAGTGALLMLPGPDEQLLEAEAVPIDEILLEAGRHGGVFWTRRWTVREVAEKWPDGTFGQSFQDLLRDKPEKEIEVHQDTIWDPKAKRWMLTVWGKDCGAGPVVTRTARTRPWITPRYYRVPGETYGRGPIMLAMPTIKTLNTAQRLTLQAAAIAMLGIYTVVDDGVFNPDLSPLTPGAFWKVGRNGGALGASVARFPDPRIDLSNLVLNDMRLAVQGAMMDQSLPPDAAAVRSATEILERVKRLASDHVGAFGRLVAEIIVPAVRRAIEIAYDKAVLPNDIQIDQLLVRLRVVSPLATAREASRVQKIVQWLEMVIALMGEEADTVARKGPALLAVAEALGVPKDFQVPPEQGEQERQRRRQAAEAAVMAEMAAKTGLLQPEAAPADTANPAPETTA